MKTLDEIISRQDYVRVNEALKVRAGELAAIFAKKFYELTEWVWRHTDVFPEHYMRVNGNIYTVRPTKTVGGEIEEVDLVVVYDYGWYDAENLVKKFVNHWLDEDYHSHQELVDFLNDAKDILQALSDREDKLVKESEEALENAKIINI